tara:strand:- start:262 stop:477 length:216 start_codon:yes stop_codon:yes gene_type:complete
MRSLKQGAIFGRAATGRPGKAGKLDLGHRYGGDQDIGFRRFAPGTTSKRPSRRIGSVTAFRSATSSKAEGE